MTRNVKLSLFFAAALCYGVLARLGPDYVNRTQPESSVRYLGFLATPFAWAIVVFASSLVLNKFLRLKLILSCFLAWSWLLIALLASSVAYTMWEHFNVDTNLGRNLLYIPDYMLRFAPISLIVGCVCGGIAYFLIRKQGMRHP